MTLTAGRVQDVPSGMPITLVERVGTVPRLAQLWRVEQRNDDDLVLRIAAFGARDKFLGMVGLEYQRDWGASCVSDLYDVAAVTGVSVREVYRVQKSALMNAARAERLLGRGEPRRHCALLLGRCRRRVGHDQRAMVHASSSSRTRRDGGLARGTLRPVSRSNSAPSAASRSTAGC